MSGHAPTHRAAARAVFYYEVALDRRRRATLSQIVRECENNSTMFVDIRRNGIAGTRGVNWRRRVAKLTRLLLSQHPFSGPLSRTTWVSRYQRGKTSLHLYEARDDKVLGCSGISWTICKQSAPRSRQISTPTPYHSNFTGCLLLLTPNQQSQSTEGVANAAV